MNMIAHIDNASQTIQNSFLDYYHSLVESFHANSDKHLSYRAFANRTERATKALACEKEAIFYTVAYGKQHYGSMEYLLANHLPLEMVNQSAIRVVDYGCGQGIATLALLEHLANHQLTANMEIEIHLIEPSIISLSLNWYIPLHKAEPFHFLALYPSALQRKKFGMSVFVSRD
ncbi:MAG: hypothetical protein KGV51_04390 [Moraxellaceae bacterium]|nr:hypothetical protein [Moraxellaceae bacterium]